MVTTAINPRKPFLDDLSVTSLSPGTSTNGGMLTHLDAGLNGHAGSGFRFHLNRLVDRLGQLLLGGIAHCLGPNVESPFPARGNFPETPDAFPFIVAAIRHVVLANIPFGPPALSVLDLVSTSDQERPDPVATFAGHHPLAKCQMQLHLVSAREVGHQKESAPRPGGKPTIGLDLRLRRRGSRRVEFRHHHRPRRFLDSLGLRVEQRTLIPSPQIRSSLSRDVQRPESVDVPSMRPITSGNPYPILYAKTFPEGGSFRSWRATRNSTESLPSLLGMPSTTVRGTADSVLRFRGRELVTTS